MNGRNTRVESGFSLVWLIAYTNTWSTAPFVSTFSHLKPAPPPFGLPSNLFHTTTSTQPQLTSRVAYVLRIQTLNQIMQSSVASFAQYESEFGVLIRSISDKLGNNSETKKLGELSQSFALFRGCFLGGLTYALHVVVWHR